MDARKQAVIDSLYGIESSVKYNYIDDMLGDETMASSTYTCDRTECKNNNGDILKFTGTVPTGGTITVDEKGVVTEMHNMIQDGFLCNKKDVNTEIECIPLKDAQMEIEYVNNGGAGGTTPRESGYLVFNASAGGTSYINTADFTFTGTGYTANTNNAAGKAIITFVGI